MKNGKLVFISHSGSREILEFDKPFGLLGFYKKTYEVMSQYEKSKGRLVIAHLKEKKRSRNICF